MKKLKLKTITLSSLLKLNPLKIKYDKLKEKIEQMERLCSKTNNLI